MTDEETLPVPEGDTVAAPDDELETKLDGDLPDLDLEEDTDLQPDDDDQEQAELKGEDNG